MRSVGSLSFASVLALAACSTSLVGTSARGNSDQQNDFGNNEYVEAKDAEDVETLSAACRLEYRVSTSSVRTKACRTAMEILVARGDTATLTDICNLDGPGQAYEEWQSRAMACDAVRE